MNKLFVSAALALFGLNASAETNQLVFPSAFRCAPTENVVKYVKESYSEYEFATADTEVTNGEINKTYPGKLTIYLSEARTYTVVVSFKEDDISCIINVGKGLVPAKPIMDGDST